MRARTFIASRFQHSWVFALAYYLLYAAIVIGSMPSANFSVRGAARWLAPETQWLASFALIPTLAAWTGFVLALCLGQLDLATYTRRRLILFAITAGLSSALVSSTLPLFSDRILPIGGDFGVALIATIVLRGLLRLAPSRSRGLHS